MLDLAKRLIQEGWPLIAAIFAVLVVLILSIVITSYFFVHNLPSVIVAALIIFSMTLISVLVILKRHIIVVDESKAVVVERFARFFQVYRGGYHVMLPYIDAIRPLRLFDPEKNQHIPHEYIDTREKLLDPPEQQVSTKDNITLTIDSIANFRIIKPDKTVYNVEDVYKSLVELMTTTLRTEIGSWKYEDLLEARDKLNVAMKKNMTGIAEDEWGVCITNVGIQKIDPPADMKDILRQKALKSQEALARDVEALSKSKEMTTLTEARTKTMGAEALAQKNAIETVAKALAAEIEALKGAFGGAGEAVILLKYFDALKEMSKNPSNKIFMPFESLQMLGAAGGITEMVKHMLDASKKDIPATPTPAAAPVLPTAPAAPAPVSPAPTPAPAAAPSSVPAPDKPKDNPPAK